MSDSSTSSSWAPLRQPTFTVLWVAAVVGNVGSFMRDVASAWVVTDLSASPTSVAMIQAAATLPAFVLALPAGVLSDLFDRRRFLIAIQLLLAATSLTLAALSATGQLTVTWLVALTCLGGTGAALMGPAWQSIVPELVPREDMRNAVALNSLGVNIARAVGPALGGLLLGIVGAAAVYGADVLSYVLVIGALLWWRKPEKPRSPLAEHFGGALRAGARYALASRELHAVLLRVAAFFAFASAVWALLPLVARGLLGGTAGFYGLLLGAVGAGAIGGAVLLPRWRARFSPDALVCGAAAAVAAVMAALAFAPPQAAALALMLVMGAAWITALTTLNGAAQAVLPDWVRGRGLAVYLMVFNGAMTLGSLAWGAVAQATSVPAALGIAAGGALVVAALAGRVPLPAGDRDLQPSRHWPEPPLADRPDHDRGPVMIQIEYEVPAAQRAALAEAMRPLAAARRRDGAFLWGLSEDPDRPELVIEWFLVESWAEHLRQHHRVSHADADLQRGIARLHVGAAPPRVSHLVGLPPAGP